MTAEGEKFYPSEENLGKNCTFWDRFRGCRFPKEGIRDRGSCEGVVDSVCLYLKDGRPDPSLSREQLISLRTTPPGKGRRFMIPPGTTS